jgi:2-acylglycerol O-acyltransferase 1
MGTEYPKIKILLVCNAEHGQANIPLAIAHELLLREDVEVHLCSFPNLQKRFERLLHDHGEEYGAQVQERAQFHELRGPTVTEVFLRSGKRGPFHAAGLAGCIEGLSNVFEDYWGWTESEYMAIFKSCAEVVERVEPTLIAIDYFFLPGRDAVQNQKRPYCLINTTSLSHIVLGTQPYHAYLWKYPM